ncbi:MAG: hypothetical protein FRX49_05342 [Trebouxia sp. A1-2]|nr:MAG: hypothetical protein FRX49_05342 [Trebouxia sp. A1-2]
MCKKLQFDKQSNCHVPVTVYGGWWSNLHTYLPPQIMVRSQQQYDENVVVITGVWCEGQWPAVGDQRSPQDNSSWAKNKLPFFGRSTTYYVDSELAEIESILGVEGNPLWRSSDWRPSQLLLSDPELLLPRTPVGRAGLEEGRLADQTADLLTKCCGGGGAAAAAAAAAAIVDHVVVPASQQLRAQSVQYMQLPQSPGKPLRLEWCEASADRVDQIVLAAFADV